MRPSVASAPDPYTLIPWDIYGVGYGESYAQYASLTQVSPRLVSGESTLVIVTIGQSNISNSVDWTTNGQHIPANAKVENLNFINGAVYRAGPRMLGCHGAGANMASWLGDLLINNGVCQRVIFAPIGMSSSGSGQWAAGGNLNHRIGVVARRLSAVGLVPDIVLHHQGEAEGPWPENAIVANYQSMIDTFRTVGVLCPILICKTSWISGAVQSDPETRAAQAAVVNPAAGVYAGADTDTLGLAYRMTDEIHFNVSGAAAFAQLAYDALIPLL